MTIRSACTLAALATGLFALGCSEPERPSGEVTGKVTIGDKLLTAGSIKFQSSKGGPTVGADIGYEGTYRITTIPPGEYKVVVETAFLKSMMPPPGGITAAPPEKGKAKGSTTVVKEKYLYVNKKYESFDLTTLKATVVPGPQVLDFDCP